MNDDFNTPKALAVMFEFLKAVNVWLDKGSAVAEETLQHAIKVLEETAGTVLGLLPADYSQLLGGGQGDVEGLVQVLIDLRSALRKEKNFALADEIRDRLSKLNIELKDTPQGTEWSYRK